MAEQLIFDFPRKTAFGRDDFFVSDANQWAVDAIEGWADWPLGKLVLVGPSGAGKSHLARIWCDMSGAQIITGEELAGADIQELGHAAVCIEDAQQVAGAKKAQDAFFHLHNMLAEAGHPLLVTSSLEPHRWGLTLADIESRMQAAQIVHLKQPDDVLLAAVLIKQFEDSQIAIDPKVVHFLLGRMDRSFGSIREIVTLLDRAALTQRRSITVPFARQVLDSARLSSE